MTSRRQKLFTSVILMALGLTGLVTWGMIRIVAWGRDLPNRISIDGDAIANAFGAAVVEFYHQALSSGDVTIQRQVLEEFSTAAERDVAARDWIRGEYFDDITALALSPDVDVAAESNCLLQTLTRETSERKPTNGR